MPVREGVPHKLKTGGDISFSVGSPKARLRTVSTMQYAFSTRMKLPESFVRKRIHLSMYLLISYPFFFWPLAICSWFLSIDLVICFYFYFFKSRESVFFRKDLRKYLKQFLFKIYRFLGHTVLLKLRPQTPNITVPETWD